jgi:hypothetical protein
VSFGHATFHPDGGRKTPDSWVRRGGFAPSSRIIRRFTQELSCARAQRGKLKLTARASRGAVASAAIDGTEQTAWCFQNRGKEPAWLEVRWRGGPALLAHARSNADYQEDECWLEGLALYPGHGASPASYRREGRPATIQISPCEDGAASVSLELPRTEIMQQSTSIIALGPESYWGPSQNAFYAKRNPVRARAFVRVLPKGPVVDSLSHDWRRTAAQGDPQACVRVIVDPSPSSASQRTCISEIAPVLRCSF